MLLNGGLNQILRRQTSRSHYGSKVPAVTVTVFKYRNKNILNKDYEEIFENELKSIDNNSKLFLFKALKSENKSEFYLKYPDFEIRGLIFKYFFIVFI
jgi:hypothetical protein